MTVSQKEWTKASGWKTITGDESNSSMDLVLVFGCRECLSIPQTYHDILAFYPNANIVLASTAGEILNTTVSDDTITVTAIKFNSTELRVKSFHISDSDNSYEAGHQISKDLQTDDLAHIFIISDGQEVNGSELVRGLNTHLDSRIPVTGGLAGDGANFQSTLVGHNEVPGEGNIVAIGFYGDSLKVGHASRGGWDSFGPERFITKSENNVLYELDGKSALDLYKKYLGDLANELPGSALLFPLSIRLQGSDDRVVRTILSVDEQMGSMTFAGDMPIGAQVRMMKSNFDRLIDGAAGAANTCLQNFHSFKPELAILISCVGRKLVLRDRVEEEIENVREILGTNTSITGFYSYGEISPLLPSTKCELHNQTMTITTFTEV